MKLRYIKGTNELYRKVPMYKGKIARHEFIQEKGKSFQKPS